MNANRILVVDDEPGVRSALEGILRDEGFDVHAVETGEAAVEAAQQERYDAVLLDVWLPGIDGLETLTQMRDGQVDSEVVMISGHGTIETAVRATKLGAFDFVEKPLSLERTLLVLRNALRQRQLERRNVALLSQLARDTEILGDGRASRKLRADVEAASGADSPVLVSGERGSGRETVVRRIHSSSRRSQEAFVEIPCGALDAASATEALFGGDGPGRFAMASRGTAYLDGIDRLEPALQVRLASLLGSGEFRELDCRLLATVEATSPDLEESLRQRVEVIRIDLPSLRERRDDILTLVSHFMSELAREYGREEKRVTSEALAALRAYDWPGNVRELRNLIERLLLTVDSETIGLKELPDVFGGAGPVGVDLYGRFPSLDDGVQAFRVHHVLRALAAHPEDREAAARDLGLTAEGMEAAISDLGLG